MNRRSHTARHLLHVPLALAGRLFPLKCLQEKRFWQYALLPLVGSLVHVGLLLAWTRVFGGMAATPVAGAVARALPSLLLVRALDRGPDGPFRLRVCWPALVVCGMCFTSTITVHSPWPWEQQRTRTAQHMLLFVAVVAGIAGAVPVREMARRLVRRKTLIVLAVVGLLPHYYDWLGPYFWLSFRPGLLAAVGMLCSWAGWDITVSAYDHPVFGPANLIRSELWELSVVELCLAAYLQALFVAFFACMLLSRPGRLRHPVAAAAGLLGGLGVLNATNAVRLAALVVVASEKIRLQGRTKQVFHVIHKFHYDGGLQIVLVSLIFIPVYMTWLGKRIDGLSD